ncbi:MAG: ABC transporter ATP-binding protein [Minisyncoccia bacterium]
MASPVIKVDNLNFYYDYKLPTETYALKDINLQINQGEYIVFFGPSGCGKTTLIYLIGGITTEKNGTGEIFVNGADVLQLSRDDLTIMRQTSIGIIFQNFNLIPSLTVLDNVALPMTFIGVPRDKRREDARKILARLDMEIYAERFPSELSGGQQQRAGIARALANNPPIVICDEPLGNLDSENAEHVLKFLKELQEKDGRTVIMVTHEAWSVRDADKIIYMKDGTIVKTDVNTAGGKGKGGIGGVLPLSPNLFRELYPDLTPGEIMIRSLSNLLLRGFSADEIKRFEFFLEERFAGRIDAATFVSFLDRPFRDEGVGLWKQRAIKIAQLTEDILAERKKLADVYAELEKSPETPITDEVASLRTYITKEYHGHLEDMQRIRLEEAITERIRGSSTPEEFRKILNQARSKNGVGLSIRTMQHVSDRLESVLALGHMGNIKEAIASIATIA